MWTLPYIFSQLCVLVAVCLYVSTFFIKSKKTVIVLTCIISLFYAIQYLLLDSATGVAINILAILRCIWFYINDQNGKTNDYLSLIVCCILFIIGGIFSYNCAFDIIPIINSLVFSYIVWQQSVKVYRYIAPQQRVLLQGGYGGSYREDRLLPFLRILPDNARSPRDNRKRLFRVRNENSVRR